MPSANIEEILQRLHSMQAELEAEIDRLLSEKRALFQYSLERGRVHFEQGMRALQRRQRIGLWQYLRQARLGHVLSAPVVYSVFLPFALLDLSVTLYQQICFRIYRIPLVRRADYIIIDRHHLAYLNAIEKFNCFYCSYGNGLIEYMREITARTEQYWCPIKHAQRTPDPHRLVEKFADYGDAEVYHERLKALRKEISEWERKNTHITR